jgi:hypothetical protein
LFETSYSITGKVRPSPADPQISSIALAALATVIPLQSYEKNRLWRRTEPRIPEPATLYSLVVLALVLHHPVPAFSPAAPGDDICGQCGRAWPCPQIKLAYRLREGF